VGDQESQQQKAIRLLTRQLVELQLVRTRNYTHPDFKVWRDTTMIVLEEFLGPESHHTIRVRDTRFYGPVSRVPYGITIRPGYISPRDADPFMRACETTDASLKAAIRHVQDFGVYIAQAKPATSKASGRGKVGSGGINQTFHAPVTMNRAIATGSAIQKIGHMGDETGSSLKEIAALLQQSEDLTPRQVKEGLAHIEAVASEVEKPEAKRDWKSILESGKAILELAGKATDLAAKFAPYTPAVLGFVEKAKHYL
jgi:hypothetical protein